MVRHRGVDVTVRCRLDVLQLLRLISGRITSLNISYSISLSYTVVTRHTLVWKRILVAVFFLCPVTDISATVAPIGVKFCTLVHIGPGQIFSPFGAVPRDPQIRNFGPKFWPFDCDLESGKSQRYMSIRA